MIISFDLSQDLFDIKDAVLLALLKSQKEQCESFSEFTHPDDRKMNKKIIKACDVLIDYYTVHS